MRLKLLAVGLVVLSGCGREPLSFSVDQGADAAAPPPEGGGGKGATTATRAPKNHRAAGASCPSERAAGSLPECPPGGTVLGGKNSCFHDSDCTDATEGSNGRCFESEAPFFSCDGVCTYDDCFDDSACPPLTPCECRASATATAPNRCVLGSNCRVDDDCGPGGFCSPSVVNDFCGCLSPDLCDATTMCTADGVKVPCACGDSCGHGHYCHTPQDSCVDDADCGDQGTCNYDRLKKRWACAICWPVV